MSFFIVRIQKFDRHAVTGIDIHDHRSKSSHSNPDIDRSRSDENVITQYQPANRYIEVIDRRIASLNLKKAVRKDAVVMCQAMITASPEWFAGKTQPEIDSFLKDATSFIEGRYGYENIVSIVKHMDEKTPHLHINFVPVKDGRLSAKAIFTREELSNLQDDFYEKIGKKYKMERGEKKEVPNRHLTVRDYKAVTKHDFDLDIKPEELDPKVLQKRFWTSTVETSEMIAYRLNQKHRGVSERLLRLKEDVKNQRRELQLQSEDYDRLRNRTRELEETLKNVRVKADKWERLNKLRPDINWEQFLAVQEEERKKERGRGWSR